MACGVICAFRNCRGVFVRLNGLRMIFSRHMMRARSQMIVPTVAPVWTNLVRVVLVIEVGVGLMVLFATLIIPRINATHQVHLNSHWLTVFGLSLVSIHLLLIYEVVALLN